MNKNFVAAASIFSTVILVSAAQAAPQVVAAIGDGGWKADDMRNGADVHLVGTSSTHAPLPGATPSSAHDTAIAQQIIYSGALVPAGSGGGAVKLVQPGEGPGKTTISTINPTGFVSGNWTSTFSADYRFYREGASNSPVAFKIGIKSPNFAASQSLPFTGATRSGESEWDLMLVYSPETSYNAPVTNNTWDTRSITATSGAWALYDQSGNAYYNPSGFGIGATNKTLAEWQADSLWGDRLFGAGALATSVQFGMGSGGFGTTYLDHATVSFLNGGDQINFVPEPATLGLLAMGAMGLLRRRRA